MRTTLSYISLILAFALSSCHDTVHYDNSPSDNFEAVWRIVDEHYCFFEYKDIDWNEVHDRYASKVPDDCSQQHLFYICSQMLDELQDGHVNLSSAFNTSYYRRWWSDYPQNYDERLVQQHYMYFNYRTIGATNYYILPQGVGYIRYPSFSYGIGEGNIDYILSHFALCRGLIIDVRDNGGGDLTNVEPWVRRFLQEPITAGYIIHKTGPGHNDFSEPYPFRYTLPEDGHLRWIKPVIVLTNRSTYSAANNFVAIMKTLPTVRIVGATTGGGGGMPYSSEIPCGWSLRLSACSILDPNGQITENGVTPSEGCAIDLDPIMALQGHDTMLDFAIRLLSEE